MKYMHFTADDVYDLVSRHAATWKKMRDIVIYELFFWDYVDKDFRAFCGASLLDLDGDSGNIILKLLEDIDRPDSRELCGRLADQINACDI